MRDKLESLRENIDAAKRRDVERDKPKEQNAAMSHGLNIALELAAGVGVGAFLGYHLDEWAQTSPLFFILCFFLGVAGGVLNIYKRATKFK